MARRLYYWGDLYCEVALLQRRPSSDVWLHEIHTSVTITDLMTCDGVALYCGPDMLCITCALFIRPSHGASDTITPESQPVKHC